MSKYDPRKLKYHPVRLTLSHDKPENDFTTLSELNPHIVYSIVVTVTVSCLWPVTHTR